MKRSTLLSWCLGRPPGLPRAIGGSALIVAMLASPTAQAENFGSGALIIPMDVSHQNDGMLEAYGLVYELLKNGIPVRWAIGAKTEFFLGPDAPPGGGPVTPAMVDFTADFENLADAADTGTHDYRGGTFVVADTDAAAALPIITAWQASTNASTGDPSSVVVHRATAPFSAAVGRRLAAAPTIAMMADGNQDIARGYLQAAWIPDSTGDLEWPDHPNCGNPRDPAGSPDMLRPCDVAGPTTTDHRDGLLFDGDGDPTYCQFMSMHWGIGDAQATPEVVAEIREYLYHPTHLYAECQAVNAFENLVTERGTCSIATATNCYADTDCPAGETCEFIDCGNNGHLDCELIDPDLRCSEDNQVCGEATGFFLTTHGFSIGDQQNTHEFHSHDDPYVQIDGEFGSVGGSEAAYSIPTGNECTAASGNCAYKAGDVVMITAGDGNPATDDRGVDDVWMTGFVDGQCLIPLSGDDDDSNPGSTLATGRTKRPRGAGDPGACASNGKVSYLGGHRYSTDVPITNNPDTQGARLFLNSLFEAPCATEAGSPDVGVVKSAPATTMTDTVTFSLNYGNGGSVTATGAVLRDTLPPGTTFVSATGGGVEVTPGVVEWDLGGLGENESGTVDVTVQLGGCGSYLNDAEIDYRVGVSQFTAVSNETQTDYCVGDGDGDGDGDGTSGDGDGTSGDGDGTSGDGDGTSGDGDGTSAGDGDGDGTSTGDGDGDGTSAGDGDGTSAGDGDGDGSAGDGDTTTGTATDTGGDTAGTGDSGTGEDTGASDTGASDTGGGTDETGGGVGEMVDGCGCTTADDSRGAPATALALLGLLTLRRRRRTG